MDNIFQFIESGDEAKVRKLVEETAQGSKNIFSKRASIPKSPLTGVPVRLKSSLSAELMSYEATPLLWAAAFGRLTMIELFLAEGADINESQKLGLTALMYAASFGFLDVVHCLIKHGANIEAKDLRWGNTALNYAAYNLWTDVTKALVTAGAAVDTPNKAGQSALRMVLKRYKESPETLEIAEVLLSAGAEVSDAEFLFSEERIVNNFSTVLLCLHHGATVNEEFFEMTRKVMAKEKETQLREILHKEVRISDLSTFLDCILFRTHQLSHSQRF